MQSSISYGNHLCTPLGERRGKSDLARFSLDLSWARAVSDQSRSRAYPSPPMSGSPPIPPRSNLDSSDRDHGSYVASGQGNFRGLQPAQIEHQHQRNDQINRVYQEPASSTPFPGPYSIPHLPSGFNPYQHQQQNQHQLPQMPQMPQMPQQLQHQHQHQHQHSSFAQQLPQPHSQFSTPDRTPIREPAEFTSPKQQRKTKGHVASACVPCKRAHLRCDAQRPCSRCLSNGKEDTCVDIQHKKRGRPRLRDEREPRYEGTGQGYPPADHTMRRPHPLYDQNNSSMGSTFGEPPSRSSSAYRVLKSQSSIGGFMPPRHLENALPSDVNIYGPPLVAPPRPIQQQEAACAYLTMEMSIVKASQSFGETIGLHSIVSRSLQDIVTTNDREKVTRLQRTFEDERRSREPHYLPPIYLDKFEEERMIQGVAFGQDDVGLARTDRQEMFTFQAPDGQQRTFQVRLNLAKRHATYFVMLFLVVPATPQMFQPPVQSPYTRESHSRESHYGYQTPQQSFAPNISPPSFVGTPTYGDLYRTPSSAGPITPQPAAHMSGYIQPQPRVDYPQTSAPHRTPRTELGQPHQSRQHDLQLPPIRDTRGETSSTDTQRRDDRSNRFDIGGLLEKPGSGPRRS